MKIHIEICDPFERSRDEMQALIEDCDNRLALGFRKREQGELLSDYTRERLVWKRSVTGFRDLCIRVLRELYPVTH